MALSDELLSLTALAGRTVVASAVTDAWEAIKRGLALLVGRGDSTRMQLTERRLDETREQLTTAPAPDLERIRAQLAAAWQTRLVDLLEEHAGLAADLQALIDEARAKIPHELQRAEGQSIAAGRDVNVTALGGGIAAGTIHGSVTQGNPIEPGPARG